MDRLNFDRNDYAQKALLPSISSSDTVIIQKLLNCESHLILLYLSYLSLKKHTVI